MNKLLPFLILLVLFCVIFVSGCTQPQLPTDSPTLTPTNLPTVAPTATPSPTQPAPTRTSTARPTSTPTTEPGEVCAVLHPAPLLFAPDSTRILLRQPNGVQVFNLETRQVEDFLESPAPLGSAFALSPDGTILAWALEDFSIQLIRLADHQLIATLVGHTDIVTQIAFSPNEDRLFSASHDTWVRVWNLEGNLLDTFQPTGADDFPSEVLSLYMSPDGTQLATVPFNGPVKIWDALDFHLIKELGGNGGYDTSEAVYSPDGQFITADLATGLYLWRTADGMSLLEGTSPINTMSVAFSPDGRYLAYADIGDNNAIILTSPDGSTPSGRLEGHTASVWDLAFSPDGKWLASVDGMEIRIWDIETLELSFTAADECP